MGVLQLHHLLVLEMQVWFGFVTENPNSVFPEGLDFDAVGFGDLEAMLERVVTKVVRQELAPINAQVIVKLLRQSMLLRVDEFSMRMTFDQISVL